MLSKDHLPHSRNAAFRLEMIPGPVPDDVLVSSVRSSLDSFAALKREATISRIVEVENGRPKISQFLSAETPSALSMLVRFYSKLYSGNILFRRADTVLDGKSPATVFGSVSLEENFVFQAKKPGELGADTFHHSASLPAGILLDISKNLSEGQFVEISFSFAGADWSRLAKTARYTWKSLFFSPERTEELEKSFSDRFPFFGFRFHIRSNASPHVLEPIVRKNLSTYASNWNRYAVSWSSTGFRDRPSWFRKAQADQLLSHGLGLPIFEPSVTPAAGRLFSTGQAVKTNNSLLHQSPVSGVQPAFLGKAFLSQILDEQELFHLDTSTLKNGHGLVLGGTGSGKSFSTSRFIGRSVIRSATSQKNLGDDFIVIDPHGSLLQNILSVLGRFSSVLGRGNRRTPETTVYGQPSVSSSLTAKNSILAFNPLISFYLRSEPDFSASFSRHAQAVLDALKGVWDASSFGARNEDILMTGIRLFLLLNISKISHPKSVPDLLRFFQDLRRSLKVPSAERATISSILADQSMPEHIRLEVSATVRALENLITSISKDTSFLETTLNKLGIFQGALAQALGQGISPGDLSLDLRALYLVPHEKTCVHLLDLSSFAYDEKGVIAAFFLAFSYHFGTRKSKSSETPSHHLFFDEFSSLAQGENMLFQLGRAMPEMRKYKVNYCVFLQEVSQAGFSQVYPHTGYILAFSVDTKQRQLVFQDFATGRPGEPALSPADIANQPRGRFLCFLKYAAGGNALLSLDGFGPADVHKLCVLPPCGPFQKTS